MAHPLIELCFAQSGDDDGAAWSRVERGARTRGDAVSARHSDVAARIRAGDEHAFEQLFGDTYPRLVRIAAAYVDGDAAADVVADVFVSVWNARSTWTPVDVDAFLYRAVRNRALNHVRGVTRELHRRETYQALDIDRSDSKPQSDDDLRTTAVRAAVAELNPRQREFVVLRWQEGRTPAEIAELLGTSVRAMTSLQDRTLATLRRRAPEILTMLLKE